MIEHGETVLIAVSGGSDSMALLYGLHELQQQLECHLHVVHLNHSMRENSGEDADFVHKHAEHLGLPLTTHTVELKNLAEEWNLSIETAGRKVRYEFFDTVCADVGATKVAIGHHQDDIVETILMNLIRGGGSDGLKGISPIRDGKYIRPLTTFTRQEIESFLKSINLVPIEDPTNTDTYYLRNRIRHELLPLLMQEYNPNIKEGLNRTASVVEAESVFLDDITQQSYQRCLIPKSQPNFIILNRETFLKNHIAIQRRIMRHAVSELIGTSRDFTFDHIKSILQAVNGDKPNAKITLSNGIQFRRAYQKLQFEIKFKETKEYEYPLNVPGRTIIAELNAKVVSTVHDLSEDYPPTISDGKSEAMLDFCKIKSQMTIRNRRIGDRFQPHGMHGTKKIKDFFMDKKVPLSNRDRIPMLVSGNEILWVIGFTTNEQYKIQSDTQVGLHLQYENTETVT